MAQTQLREAGRSDNPRARSSTRCTQAAKHRRRSLWPCTAVWAGVGEIGHVRCAPFRCRQHDNSPNST